MFTVKFKSIEPFYSKEKRGVKNNTVRFTDDGKRFELLRQLEIKMEYGFIEITNPDTREKFIRRIKDVSIYENIFIITWHEIGLSNN